MTRTLAIALGIGLAACGPAPPPGRVLGRCELVDAGAACVELGVGAAAEVAAETIPIVHGPQGGWHLEVGLRLGPGAAVPDAVEYSVRYEARMIGRMRYAIEPRLLERDEGGWRRRVGDIVILDVADGSEVIGREVEVVVVSAGQEIDRRELAVID